MTDLATAPILSSNWEWIENEEVFDCNGFGYDIDKSKRIIRRAPRPIVTVLVADYSGLFEAIPVHLDHPKGVTYDIAFPLLFVTMRNGGRLLIDGWHRLDQAVKQGIETLPAVRGDEESAVLRCRSQTLTVGPGFRHYQRSPATTGFARERGSRCPSTEVRPFPQATRCSSRSFGPLNCDGRRPTTRAGSSFGSTATKKKNSSRNSKGSTSGSRVASRRFRSSERRPRRHEQAHAT